MIKHMRILHIGLLALAFIVLASLSTPNSRPDPEMRVSKALAILGDSELNNYPNLSINGVSAERGKSLVMNGFSSKPGGGDSRKQSKHFVCTSCHNLQKEDPDLSVSDPQARLEYTAENGMPFLQATSLYGVVNRSTFYNDDYEKKYGDLVDAARNDIRGAIQLCATECAQGRPLRNWELESVLAYLWTIDLKLKDLILEDDEITFIAEAIDHHQNQDSAVMLIKSKYLDHSPAHFGTAEGSKIEGKKLEGDAENGKLIYENSCLHCHKDRKYSYLLLDDSKLTFKHLCGKSDGYGHHSIYQVTRYGVFSKSGKRSYMPQYPFEKLSEQQLKDLDSYIKMRAE